MLNIPVTLAVLAGVALMTVAVPGPIMMDMLGVGLASLGVGMFRDHR